MKEEVRRLERLDNCSGIWLLRRPTLQTLGVTPQRSHNNCEAGCISAPWSSSAILQAAAAIAQAKTSQDLSLLPTIYLGIDKASAFSLLVTLVTGATKVMTQAQTLTHCVNRSGHLPSLAGVSKQTNNDLQPSSPSNSCKHFVVLTHAHTHTLSKEQGLQGSAARP